MGVEGRMRWLVVLLALMCGACGNEGENDQAVSFRLIGIFQGERQEDQCQVPTTDNAISDQSIALPLNNSSISNGYPDSSSFLSFCRGFLQLQNNLFGQRILIDRIDFEYEVPGSSIAVPSGSFPTGLSLNPADADAEQNPNSFGAVNTFFTQLDGQLVPSTLILFLRQNQPSLPQLPYVMIVHVTARGRTESGDLIVSNETRYTVEWVAG